MKSQGIVTVSSLALAALLGGCKDEEPPVNTKSCVGEVAWFIENATGTAKETGLKPANAFGLHDMLGNAVEWVADCFHDTYDGAPVKGEAWNKSPCDYRVIRGGCYGSTARGVRVSQREGVTTGFYGTCAPGIRCVRAPGATPPDGGNPSPDAGVADGGASATDGGSKAEAGLKLASLSWVSIPAGSFTMGCSSGDADCYPNESPAHEVTVAAFEMTKVEVTQQQYFDQTGESPATNHCPACAATYVDWEKAKAFCEAQGGRLPTEAEWEYAARGGTKTKYPCGE